MKIPVHLQQKKEIYKKSPREASKEWFKEAGLGLFLHYGLYALHGKGEWGMFNQTMPLQDYEKLAGRFTAERFDADFITDLALEAGAGYVNFTAKHHDGFCLWDSAACDFNSVNSAAKKDLVGELADACRQKGLGFFIYYSYALDWHHPWFFSLEYFDKARPAYQQTPSQYLFRKKEDFARYIDFVRQQLRELLTGYGDIAGVWFDPEMAWLAQPEIFDIEKTYDLIRSLQPHTLIAFKHGATGEEDFAAPEGRGLPLLEKVRKRLGESKAEKAKKVWESHQGKRGEICDTLSWSWGYHTENENHSTSPDEVLQKLMRAWKQNCNLLINTAPLPDGSIPEVDVNTLRQVGQRIRNNDLPGESGKNTFSSALPDSTPIT